MEFNKTLLKSLEGKTDEQKKERLAKIFGEELDILQQENGPCTAWFAQVFSYNTESELQNDLDIFFAIINLLAFLFNLTFEQEDTVFLGCTCPCGVKQLILYCSLTSID